MRIYRLICIWQTFVLIQSLKDYNDNRYLTCNNTDRVTITKNDKYKFLQSIFIGFEVFQCRYLSLMEVFCSRCLKIDWPNDVTFVICWKDKWNYFGGFVSVCENWWKTKLPLTGLTYMQFLDISIDVVILQYYAWPRLTKLFVRGFTRYCLEVCNVVRFAVSSQISNNAPRFIVNYYKKRKRDWVNLFIFSLNMMI